MKINHIVAEFHGSKGVARIRCQRVRPGPRPGVELHASGVPTARLALHIRWYNRAYRHNRRGDAHPC